MIDARDDLLALRFAAVATPPNDSDWVDVMRRVRTPHRRRTVLVTVLAATVAAVAAAVALGWPQSLINFLSAPAAPKRERISFGMQNVLAPPGMSPKAIPGEARLIMRARFDGNTSSLGRGSVHSLYVAPTRSGSFCYQWTRFEGSCAPAKADRAKPASRGVVPLGIGWSETTNELPGIISGYVLAGKTATLEAHFADGTNVTIPVTWVSAPINAGFFLYQVPATHRQRATALITVTAKTDNGQTVARQTFPLPNPLDRDTPRRLPDGTRIDLAARAEVAKARKAISFRATNGSAVWLWVMPARGGGSCYVFNQGGGCLPAHPSKRIPATADGLFSGGDQRVLYFEQALRPGIAQIQLHYQDGTIERLTPTDGFILHEITPAHYPRGHRLEASTALNQQGSIVSTHRFRPNTDGVYPCKNPVARGYGIKSCP